MATIKCFEPGCDNIVSDKALRCPRCGCPIADELKRLQKENPELAKEAMRQAVRDVESIQEGEAQKAQEVKPAEETPAPAPVSGPPAPPPAPTPGGPPPAPPPSLIPAIPPPVPMPQGAPFAGTWVTGEIFAESAAWRMWHFDDKGEWRYVDSDGKVIFGRYSVKSNGIITDDGDKFESSAEDSLINEGSEFRRANAQEKEAFLNTLVSYLNKQGASEAYMRLFLAGVSDKI